MSTASNDYYYAHDHLYNVSALIDSAGDAVEYYEYDAYGKVTAITDDGGDGDWWDGDETTATSSALGNPYYFTGRRLDDLDSHNLLVMYYLRRSYLPKMGLFI